MPRMRILRVVALVTVDETWLPLSCACKGFPPLFGVFTHKGKPTEPTVKKSLLCIHISAGQPPLNPK